MPKISQNKGHSLSLKTGRQTPLTPYGCQPPALRRGDLITIQAAIIVTVTLIRWTRSMLCFAGKSVSFFYSRRSSLYSNTNRQLAVFLCLRFKGNHQRRPYANRLTVDEAMEEDKSETRREFQCPDLAPCNGHLVCPLRSSASCLFPISLSLNSQIPFKQRAPNWVPARVRAEFLQCWIKKGAIMPPWLISLACPPIMQLFDNSKDYRK